MACDTIQIDRLKIYAYHGVFSEEKEKGQYFYVSASMKTDLRRAGKRDDLTASTHYGEVSELIQKIVTKNTWDLIESVAEHCAEAVLLQFPLIQEITLTVSKPDAPIPIPFSDVSVTVTRGWHKVYVAFGSNMGDREQHIDTALQKLRDKTECRNLRESKRYVTPPYGGVEQDDFLNGVCCFETLFSPEELLDDLHQLEQEANRERIVHWGPRTLDLDILFYDAIVMETDDLIIPHPDMQNRRFVLEPLNDLTHYYEHPVYHLCVKEMLENL